MVARLDIVDMLALLSSGPDVEPDPARADVPVEDSEQPVEGEPMPYRLAE